MFTSRMFKTKKRKGFSLVEALIAILIFSIAMTTLLGTFSSFLKNYANGKRIQKDIENAQYAMNIIAKTLRTSSLVTTTLAVGSPFNVYDYSRPQYNCIQYSYTGSKLQVRTTTDISPASPASCNWASLATAIDLTSDSIISTSLTATKTLNNVLGVVTLSLGVRDPKLTSAIPIQMSVSLRQ